MAEDLLDLGNLQSGPQHKNGSQDLSLGESSGTAHPILSHSSNMADLWGINAPASPSTTAIPRFTEAPPSSPSSALFAPSPSTGGQVSQHSTSSSSISSGSTGSTMLQLQDLWYAPNSSKTPSKSATERESSSSPSPSSVLPPVMSPTPPPNRNSPQMEPQTAHASTLLDAHQAKPAHSSSSLQLPSSSHSVTSEHAEKVHMLPASAYVSEKPLDASTSTAPPFQVWSPAVESSASPSIPSVAAQEEHVRTTYHVTTVAQPPGSVEQESLSVMKDMLRTMSDMTRRMLNMEERISRLEMEKEQLARTVNRLQETQHQMAVRQEVPKPVAIPASGYPPGFPPGYTAVTSTYTGFPPTYGAPVSNVVPGRPR